MEGTRHLLARVEHDGHEDMVAVEEPLEVRVGAQPLSVTMRTPGHDDELAVGFLHGEGLLATDGPVAARLTDDLAANTIVVEADLARDASARRFYTTSSCGVCGRGALDEVAVQSPFAIDTAAPRIQREVLASLPDRLRQPGFEATGGLHATGLFDPDGTLLVVREDVGRHNAMDKVIGRRRLDGALPMEDLVLCVSGRLSFELVQKTAMAGCPILVGVGAPTSLAISLAHESGITLSGFARGGRVNIYTHEQRID